jgi:hypothetical protein
MRLSIADWRLPIGARALFQSAIGNRRSAIVAALLFAISQAVIAAEPPAPPPATSAPFLWEVQAPKARHFLLGSVHLLPPSAHPLPASYEAAYKETRALVLEADLDDLAAPEVQNRMLGAGREDRPGGLKARIGNALYQKLQKRAAQLGMPTPVCDAFRAWFCALALELFPLQQAGFSLEHGIDAYFYARAVDDGRPIAGLETAEFQTSLFTTMSEALARQLLAATLDEDTYSSQTPEELHRIWRTGDVAAMTRLLKELQQRYPDLYRRLLVERNQAWLPTLAERLGGETPQLVVVGAAHFVGPAGLLTMLKAKGFDAKPAAGVVELAEPPGK